MKRFLIDGFPRALDQVEAFERHVCRARTALFFDCPEDVMLARALQRGRTDDNAEAMQKRLDLFRETSMPVVDLFDSQGRLMRFDNSRPEEEVATDVLAAFLQLHGTNSATDWRRRSAGSACLCADSPMYVRMQRSCSCRARQARCRMRRRWRRP